MSYLVKMLEFCDDVLTTIKIGGNYKSLRNTLKHTRLVHPYLENNYSQIYNLTSEHLKKNHEFSIETFAHLPIYNELVSWRTDTTDELLDRMKKEDAEKFADVHVAFAVGMYAADIKNTKKFGRKTANIMAENVLNDYAQGLEKLSKRKLASKT